MKIENISLFTEITTEESATVSGGDGPVTLPVTGTTPTPPGSSTTGTTGTTVNFDLNGYLFRIGAGALFDGGLTTNVVNLAFQGSISTKS